MLEQPEIFSSFLNIGMELIFFITILIFTLYSLTLAYHWFAYGVKLSTATLALAIYLLGSAPFLLVMSLSLLS